jgi:5-formyltetrahydrofolate cyclo-ligase
LSQSEKAQWRWRLRAARQSIPAQQAHAAAQAACLSLINHALWQRARSIGLYQPGDGEIDTQLLIEHAWQANKSVYLPVIRPPRGEAGRKAALRAGRLVFRRFTPHTPLRRGLLGIPEPIQPLRPSGLAAASIAIAALDLLVMPLVGVDAAGHRLGMGAGFYDRALAGRGRFRRPFRLGLAHACQQVPALPHDPWDEPLEACVTDQTITTW